MLPFSIFSNFSEYWPVNLGSIWKPFYAFKIITLVRAHTHTLIESGKPLTPILQKSVKIKEEGITWNVVLEKESIKCVFGLLMRLVKEASPKCLLRGRTGRPWQLISALCTLWPLCLIPAFIILAFSSLWDCFTLFNMMNIFDSKECLMQMQTLSDKSTYCKGYSNWEVCILWKTMVFILHDISLSTY